MLNILIKAVFWIVGKIGDIVLFPIMALINTIFPTFSFNLDYIFTYFNYGLNYIIFFFKLLMIPPICIELLLSVFTISLSLFVGLRTYQFIVKIYDKFKP